LAKEAQKRETGSIDSGGGSQGGSGLSQIRIGDSENLWFHLNSRVSHFSLNVTFLCKLGHFSDFGETVDSRGVLGSSPEMSFLAPEIAYFDQFGQVGSGT